MRTLNFPRRPAFTTLNQNDLLALFCRPVLRRLGIKVKVGFTVHFTLFFFNLALLRIRWAFTSLIFEIVWACILGSKLRIPSVFAEISAHRKALSGNSHRLSWLSCEDMRQWRFQFTLDSLLYTLFDKVYCEWLDLAGIESIFNKKSFEKVCQIDYASSVFVNILYNVFYFKFRNLIEITESSHHIPRRYLTPLVFIYQHKSLVKLFACQPDFTRIILLKRFRDLLLQGYR